MPDSQQLGARLELIRELARSGAVPDVRATDDARSRTTTGVEPGVAAAQGADGLLARIETDLRHPRAVGAGSFLRLQGWCYHPSADIRRLAVVLAGTEHAIDHACLPRPDVLRAHSSFRGSRRALESGFWTLLPLPRTRAKLRLSLSLRATLADGRVVDHDVGEVEVEAGAPASAGVPALGPAPKVALCMATFNPRRELLERQIRSIKAQTYSRWTCVISDDCSSPEGLATIRRAVADDPRFAVHPSDRNRGFYYNFERALRLVPSDAELIGFADQDDDWRPDKLETLVAAFTPATTLAYSDMRVVDTSGAELHATYWVGRDNNHTDLRSLLLANTVTGAASLFRATLLPLVLPFPERVGDSFHDHWVACVALAAGDLTYVDRPLYDYYQHAGNVLGHYPHRPRGVLARIVSIFASSPSRAPLALERAAIARARDIYFKDLLGLVLVARTLLVRLQNAAPEKRRVLERFARADRSLLTLWRELLSGWRTERVTLGAEARLLYARLTTSLVSVLSAMPGVAAVSWARARLRRR